MGLTMFLLLIVCYVLHVNNGLICFIKTRRALIIQGHNNHMPPITSNNEGRVNNKDASVVEKKTFQVTPLSLSVRIGAIYTIRLECGLIRPF